MITRNMIQCLKITSLFLLFSFSFSLKLYAKNNGLKILILVIDSDDLPIYKKLRCFWRSYMHCCPKHVEAYFIRGNSNIQTEYLIQGDVIWLKTKENLIPGVLNKTILSLEAFSTQINNKFHYILRTNLSSFYIFSRLLKFLESCPRKLFYAGCCGYYQDITFVGGAGFILTPDLVNLMVSNKHYFMNNAIIDDVAIGKFMKKQKINPINLQRIDFLTLESWNKNNNNIPADIFHFRIKNNNQCLRAIDDAYIYSQLVKKFY